MPGGFKTFNFMPIPLGAVIGIAAANIGSKMFSQSNANKSNVALQREQNEWNYQQWLRESAYNTEMWNKTNAYNTPAAQRKRYEEAGLNPYLMMDNIESGMATSQTAPSANSAPPAQVESLMPDISAQMRDAVAVQNAVSQSEKTQAETQLINEQTSYFGAKALAEINELRARGAMSWRQADSLKQQYDFFDEFRLDNARALWLQNEYTKQRIEESHLQQDALKIQNDLNRINLEWLPKEKAQSLSLALARTISDIRLNSSNIDLNTKYGRSVAEQATKTNIESQGLRLSNSQFKQLMPYVLQQAKLGNYSTIENMVLQPFNTIGGLLPSLPWNRK